MSKSIFKLSLVMATGAILAVPAFAATAIFHVGVGSVTAIPNNNDFKGDLNSLGYVDYTDVGATIAISKASRLKFEFLGKEAGFTNTFQALPLSYTAGPPQFQNLFATPVLIGERVQPGGAITDWFFLRPDATSYGIGTQQFGIFLPAGFQQGGLYKSRVLYLGFDDTGAGPDDNHDDMIIRVTVVPEPATWAMLIAGFGLIGAAARRRRAATGIRGHRERPSAVIQ